MAWFRNRVEALQEIQKRFWFRCAFFVWVLFATYDTFVSQFLPKEWASKFPNFYKLAEMTSGYLPYWGWLLILAGIFCIAVIEFTLRRRLPAPVMVYGGDTLVATGVLGPKPGRDTKLHEALAFIETGQWGGRFHDVTANPGPNSRGFSVKEFRQAALDGDIRVWGRLSHSGPHILINPDYWELWKVEWFSAIESQSRTELAEVGYTSFDRRYDLMVSKAEIEKRWPPKQ